MSQFRPTFFIPLFAFLGLAIIGGLALQGTFREAATQTNYHRC